MTRLLHIVGCKNAGKTRTVELLVPRLSARLGRIGTIKHAERGHFHWERSGTDTDRHFQAGSAITGIVSGEVFAVEVRADTDMPALADLIRTHYPGIALVLAEGYGGEPGLKIEVQREGYTDRDIVRTGEGLASYGDRVRPRDWPHFDYGREEDLADYVVANLDRLTRVD